VTEQEYMITEEWSGDPVTVKVLSIEPFHYTGGIGFRREVSAESLLWETYKAQVLDPRRLLE